MICPLLKIFKKKTMFHTWAGLFLFLTLIIPSQLSYAEQTIINVPSSEVLPIGDILLKESTRARTFCTDEYATITPSMTLGIGHGGEISTGVGTTLDGNTLVRGNFSAKKVWFLGASTRLTVGGSINPYFTQSKTPDNLLYSHFSHRIKKTRTSLTAGGYINGQKSVLNNGGLIFGVEQVLIPNKLRLAFDWLSGTDSYGKMGIGLKYRPVPTVSVTGSIIIPNKDNDNIAFNVSISKFISLKDENPIRKRL